MKEKCHFNQREKTIDQSFPSCFFLPILVATTTCILLLFADTSLKAQQKPVLVSQSPKQIIAALDSFKSRLPIEKLYLQTDKPYYTIGDTLWFKSYLLNADYLTPSTKSGLLYIELDNAVGRMVKRIMVPVSSGVSLGDIALDELEISEGSYTLRAYTNWMRNFGEDYIFKRNIYISALNNSTLVKANFKLDSVAGKNKVQANLTFTNLNQDAIRLKDMQLKVMNGGHNLFKDKATTGMDGSIHFNFDLADKTQLKNLSIIANQTGKNKTDTATLTIPVTINRAEDMDVQFMPEGGNLVAGILTKVGFKAIGEDGKGTDVSGKIINSKNQTITPIQTLHKGMGAFELTPEANENYTAVINLPKKTTKSYALPKVNPVGTALRITEKGNDSLQVILSNTVINNTNYFLIGQSRGVICYAATINFKDAVIKKVLSKNLFPTGIARFTLLNNLNQPLNERIVYINHNDNLDINITADKPGYTTRDSIALAIQVMDKDNKPVHGTFSLAVTDNDQVGPDTAGSNIVNDLLFTSDLKGTVEEPGWYFSMDNSNKATALDNLLLTQGWVGYDWKQVFDSKPLKIEYPSEKEFIIQGKVTNVFNNPIEKSQVLLIGRTPAVFRDTITDKDGIFTFKKLFPIDTAEFKLEARNKKGRDFNVGIELENEFKPPAFTSKQTIIPWYINSDTTLLNNSKTKADQLQAEADYRGEGHLLKVVQIKNTRIIPDSHNLNGPGEADETITEKEIKQIKPTKTLYELLKEKYKWFYKTQVMGISGGLGGPVHYSTHTQYELYGHHVIMLIDGMHATDDMMDILGAEDIKGIEIMRTSRYALAYDPRFVSQLIMSPEEMVPIFLEITTYAGKGPFFPHTAGTYIYRTLPFTLPKQFYRPKYTANNINAAKGTDLRSTIHWEPNVITDKNGKAIVSFFSADKPADYTVIMEGTDLNGSLGYQRKKLRVNSNTVATK